MPDEELPEITDDMLDRAVYSVGGTVLPTPRRRGRPSGTGKKVATTIRFDRDVVAGFRALGRGWQTRMNEALRDWLSTHEGETKPRQTPRAG
ncbi:MAG: BrnA antitoxin family protein [Candidatus Lambdaproteobacteria bacterium]|nr:BrnA antitoxin family protein [Candidatus Lambdaproteobacteria bacterium]